VKKVKNSKKYQSGGKNPIIKDGELLKHVISINYFVTKICVQYHSSTTRLNFNLDKQSSTAIYVFR